MPRIKIDRKDKKCHRKFVWLAESEYAHLCEILGKDQTERWIDELNLHLGSKGDKYASHYYTIQVWARRAATKASPSPLAGVDRGDGASAADKVIEALKDVAKGKYMPDFDERTRSAIYAVCSKRKARWADLHEMRHDTTYMEEIHADIVKEYK